MRENNQTFRSDRLTMNSLQHLIQLCHQRHEKPLRQRRTMITPALYKGLPYHFTVHCAWRYPVKLYELEQANISFMPIGRAPEYDRGPIDFGGHRFYRQQRLQDWEIGPWYRSWGIQIYTGTPSQYNGAEWHDIDFKYDAICAAPDAVLTCIKALVASVANPLLTLSGDGGLRFSCRVLNYLHPNTDEAKEYIYKRAPTQVNSHHRDVYLEILGETGYSCWDARYEILLGNLLDPPTITKEVLFDPIDALRDVFHQLVLPEKKELESTDQAATVVPVSLGSYNLDLAKAAFLKRGYTYLHEKNSIHHWTPSRGEIDEGRILLWEREGVVWVRTSIPNIELPLEAKPITDIWDDTGILPPVPSTGLPVSEKVLAVREGKLSPLAIKRPSPVLYKRENGNQIFRTREENVVQIQRVFNRDARILGLITERGVRKSDIAASYVLNGGSISLSGKFSVAEKAAQRFQQRNLPSVAQRKHRTYLWEKIKEIPTEVRMATPFQHGNVCEDPERCDAVEEKGGDPSEIICPKCPVYVECQQHGYLSQPSILQRAEAQIFYPPTVLLDPQASKIVEELLEQANDTERLCIVDEAKAGQIFLNYFLPKAILDEWRVNWHGNALGNLANALLNALESKSEFNSNAITRVRAAMQAFDGQEDIITQQMCQVNIPGKVIPRGVVDTETGKELARFSIEFEGGVLAYSPLDDDATNRLIAQKLPFFPLQDFVLNEDIRIPMPMAQAINLGILDIGTLESIRAFPTVCQDSNWTFWHQLKRFFSYYQRDADAPMLWDSEVLRFWVPPVLHPSIKRLLFMSSDLSERELRKAFPDEEIEVRYIEPTVWMPGNRVFQIRTGTYPRRTILNYDTDWDILGMSEMGQHFFLSIQAEIERDLHVKHALIAAEPVLPHLQNIAAKKNVCFVAGFKAVEKLDTAYETADVIWIVGTPYWTPGLMWRQSQIWFGNDEKPLCYEGEMEYDNYKDERVQSVYERNATSLLTQIVSRVGLDRLPNKTVVLLTAMPLPNITDRAETLLFDWKDFEVAGGLNKLPEVIAERQRFETERDNLTAESGREKVEQVLGISSSQANRVLMKLRGGKIQRVPFHDQIHALLEDGEKKTTELIAAIEGHPGAIKNELKRLVDIGEIVRVRRGVYALPKT